MENNNDDLHKHPEEPPPDPKQENAEEQGFTSRMSDRVTDWAGVERLEGFNLGDVFSEAFKRHTSEEVEEHFTVGTRSTTPPIEQVETGWPRPWVFLRTFLGAAFVYFIFLQAWNEYYNDNVMTIVATEHGMTVDFIAEAQKVHANMIKGPEED